MRIFGLALLSALVFMAAGCGDDDDEGGDNGGGGTTAAETTGGGEAEEEEPAEEASALDEETLTQFIDAVNEDAALLCDPDNITAELLEQLGGEEECLAAAEEEPSGEPYEILDITIEGDSAVATIEDEDSTDEVTFVLEGDEIKVSSVEEVE